MTAREIVFVVVDEEIVLAARNKDAGCKVGIASYVKEDAVVVREE
jgi:hypothetical protein